MLTDIKIGCSVRSDAVDNIDNEPEFGGFDATVYFEDEYSGKEELFRGTDQKQRSQRTSQGKLSNEMYRFHPPVKKLVPNGGINTRRIFQDE